MITLKMLLLLNSWKNLLQRWQRGLIAMVHARLGELQTMEEVSIPQQDQQVKICQLPFISVDTRIGRIENFFNRNMSV